MAPGKGALFRYSMGRKPTYNVLIELASVEVFVMSARAQQLVFIN